MTNSTGRKKIACVTFVVLLFASVVLMVSPVQADPAGVSSFQQSVSVPTGVSVNATTDTKSILSFRPNPIGVGQQMLINVWINPSLNSHRGILTAKTGAFKVTVTKPDGTQDIVPMVSTFSDAASWAAYTPSVAGQYTIKFEFLGTYWPGGYYYNGWLYDTNVGGGAYINSTYYRPSSTGPFNFTVQQDMVASYPPSPLPTDYWTRPVNFAHREWWTILGNWPSTGYQGTYLGDYWNTLYPGCNPTWSNNYLFEPFVQGPESAHIVWKIERGGARSGGMIGAYGTIEGQYIDPGVPTVVYNGRCYQTYTKPVMQLVNGTYRTLPGSVAACYDLRTGEIYYEIPVADGGVTPQYVTYITPSANTRYGEVTAGATHNVELIAFSNNRLYKVHPYTGAINLNVSVPAGLSPSVGAFTPQTNFMNQVDGYVFVIQDLGVNATNAPGGRYRAINWTTSGTTSNFTARIISNTTYARSSLALYIDYGAGKMVDANNFNIIELGGWYGLTLPVYDVKTGQLLMNITSPHPDTSYSMLCTCVDHGKVAEVTQDGHVKAWDLATGRLAWDFAMDYPWGATGWGVYGVASAYGMFFRPSYDGLYAINWTNGELVWKTSRYTDAAFESPYVASTGGGEVNPGMTNVRIADGKIYIYDGEHSPNQPRNRSWALWCLDAFTGEILWKIHMVGSISFGQEPSTGPIVDGYLMFPSTDGVMYTFGRGKSAMTMSGPTTAVPLGTKAVVSGTVMDVSPAQPNTPCVSKDSMMLQMEYLHYSQPITGIWGNETIYGVPVHLTAIDENGAATDLGTTTTNGYTGVFTFAWAAPKEGKYEIVASFGPDESYGSSTSSTAVYVGPAPSEPQIDIPTQTDYMPTLNVILAAVAVAVIIGIVAVLLALRKR